MREHIEYFRPTTVDEAVAALTDEAGIIAGGTDMMIDLRSGSFKGSRLVDVTGIEELRVLKEEGDTVIVGAGVKIEELRSNELVRTKLPALAQAANKFAGLQVRNQATIGGNVGHAAPCGDTHPPLILYDGVAEVAGPGGREMRPVAELFSGPNRSALKAGELLVRFILKPDTAALVDFQKIGRRKDLAISRVSLAVLADKNDKGLISRAKVVLGACMPTTRRMPRTEEFLNGQAPSLAVFREAAGLMAAEMIEVTGRRPSLAYKEPAIQGLLMRMLLPLIRRF
ncbi:hypothetical protein C4J81_07220 [Deltaproteobacteria bacterium Smac51]|nr:hypothetical protein C4J81_07220 [Deltaproteobacteria bacterium Smac51]